MGNRLKGLERAARASRTPVRDWVWNSAPSKPIGYHEQGNNPDYYKDKYEELKNKQSAPTDNNVPLLVVGIIVVLLLIAMVIKS